MATPTLAPLYLKRRPSDGLYSRQAPILEPDEHGPNAGEDWLVTALIRPETYHVRAPRYLDMAGDFASAVIIIAGGVFAYGFAHLA
ncbi:hypothetical protein [Methylobacterium sp. CM6247]